jgi:hypothetical protein
MKAADTPAAARPRRLLFHKYFTALFVAVVVPLLANGASEAWFGYRDQREVLSQRLTPKRARRPVRSRLSSTTSPTSCNGRCNCRGVTAWTSPTASTYCG